MRARNKVEAEAREVKRQISEVEGFKQVASSPAAEALVRIYDDSIEYYRKAIEQLDETNPDLNREYAKFRACLRLVEAFRDSLTQSQGRLDALKEKLIGLNVELQEHIAEAKRREQNRM